MIFNAIKNQPKENIAIRTLTSNYSYDDLLNNIELVEAWLIGNNISSLALYCENQPEWIFIDLACQKAGIIFTAIPPFFSDAQIDTLISSVKPDVIISKYELPFYQPMTFPLLLLAAYRLNLNSVAKTPINTTKVTFTSGSTGNPKGVCLSTKNQQEVASSLVKAINIEAPIHLCLLSLSTLLENVAGIYAPLLAGGSIWLLNSDEIGFDGASLSNAKKFLNAISITKPQTIILVPELLQLLLMGVKQGWQPPAELEFIAVGGSKVSYRLIYEARKSGLPVFQGYGLSECGSVVSITNRSEGNSHSCGHILPHLKVSVQDGELIIKGNVFLGYINDESSWYPTVVNTGDIAELSNNSLEIKGRIKNLIINSFGRNISPEWVESELLATGCFKQVIVIGDSRPFCIAIGTEQAGQNAETVNQVLARVNQTLPSYAQVKELITLKQAMTFEQGLMTTNGRPKRQAIEKHFSQQIENIYQLASNQLEIS